MLNGGWPCGQGEGLLGSDGGDEGVLGEGRQIGEKGSEAVDREAVAGSAGGLLGDGGAGALGFGDDAGALRFGGLLVAVVVEHRRQALAHMPFQVVGEHANKDVAAHAIGQPVIDRPDLEVDRLDVIGLIWRSTVLMQRKARSTRLKDMAPKSKSDTPEILGRARHGRAVSACATEGAQHAAEASDRADAEEKERPASKGRVHKGKTRN